MITQFTKTEFEDALPMHKVVGNPLWKYEGFNGEHVYSLPVSAGVKILIWSSIGKDGLAGATGENSIRCYLAKADNSPLSNKSQSYITRVTGWEKRLTQMLRSLWEMGKQISKPCGCGHQLAIFWCKQGANKGRRFIKCQNCGSFSWVDAAKAA